MFLYIDANPKSGFHLNKNTNRTDNRWFIFPLKKQLVNKFLMFESITVDVNS